MWLRYVLIAAIVLQGLLTLAFILNKAEPIPQIKEFTPPTEKVLEESAPPLPDLVVQINNRNRSIQSFSCESMTIKTWERGIKFRLKGELQYEKDRNFRMVLRSVFGDELDLGSNDDVFWYWSRRDKEPGLYWAKHEDYNKTRLKTPFNPMFMRDTLGLNELPEGARIIDGEDTLLLVYQKTNSLSQPILYTVIVDKQSQMVNGLLITDLAGQPLAAAEIRQYQNGLPIQILYNWYEESKILLLELQNPTINRHISSRYWEPPNQSPRIDMAKD